MTENFSNLNLAVGGRHRAARDGNITFQKKKKHVTLSGRRTRGEAERPLWSSHTGQQEEMATELTCRVVTWMFVLVLVSSIVPTAAAAEQTKTVEFNVKPGGVVHTFSQSIVSHSGKCESLPEAVGSDV